MNQTGKSGDKSGAGWMRDVLQTVLRMIPWPTEPGLRAVGNPGPDSPVVVTCNYDLTVRRVIRALAGSDAWLVVAPSAGINVWCAASGGHFGTHQVVTALKTSGIEERVRHRRAILPQLGATGIQAREVQHRCGWRVRFGPVYAADLPRYLDSGQKKDEEMRRVRFGAFQRFEMAVAWGVPAALVAGALAIPFRPAWSLPLAALALGTAFAVFFLYDRLPRAPGSLLAAASAGVAVALVSWAGGGGAALLAALLAPLLLLALLTFDYSGSTPIEGGSHFAERAWHIVVDPDRCRGVFSCFEACPEGCFEKQQEPRLAIHAHPERCIRCGACVVQCPQDAVHFEDENGQRIEPETIRRFKLNLMGKRAVDADARRPA
jgi:NAD-dependent dihydropyrimidine dehydrogenase PreA subunit